MNKFHIAFLFSLLLLFPGCVSNDYYARATSGEPTKIDFSNPEAVCPTGDCVCMTCGTVPAPEPYSLFYNFSYAGKSCSFQPCTQRQYLDSISPNPNGEYMNFFMLGQGGFGDFGTANPYCNNSLRMPVKWLDTQNSVDGLYPLPDAGRATCFLEKGDIPVYILYSGGKSVDIDRAAEIAALFNGKGPVVITTEMGFDSSDPLTRSAVEEQARRMKAACPNCLIALAPRLGENSTEFDDTVHALGNSIDLFAFGINSRNSTSCDSAALYYEGVSYSEQLLYKYKKPSILAYVLFDKGWNDAHTCLWDDSLIASAYSDFYTYAPAFPSSGIIGVSLYSLSGVGSLPCEGCGLVDSLGNPTPAQGAWFSQCQQAYASKAIIPLVFSNAPGTTCAFGPNAYSYAGTSFYTQSPPPEAPAEAAPTFYKCDACAATRESKVINLHPYNAPGDLSCTIYPELDSYADIRDLDPAYVRAHAYWESGLDNCKVAYSTAPCGRVTRLYSISDPSGACPTQTAPSGKNICDLGLMMIFATPRDTWDGIEFMPFMMQAGGQLDQAISCAPDGDFNPFNPANNACVGTYEMSNDLKSAKSVVASHESDLGLTQIKSTYGEDEYETDKGLITLFIERFYFDGSIWTRYGSGWLDKFREYSKIDDSYCSGHKDHPCCAGGHVNACCGKPDFINFVANENCVDLSTPGASPGDRQSIINARKILQLYMGVREKCGICDEKQWEDNLNAWAESSTPSAGG